MFSAWAALAGFAVACISALGSLQAAAEGPGRHYVMLFRAHCPSARLALIGWAFRASNFAASSLTQKEPCALNIPENGLGKWRLQDTAEGSCRIR